MTKTLVVTIPQETVNDESVRILSWKIPSGARVDKDQFLCDVETSKAVMEIHAPAAGVVEYSVAAGDEVPVGATICQVILEGFNENGVASPQPGGHKIVTPEAAVEASTDGLGPARLTPLARKIAAEYGIDVMAFQPGTLVRQRDVLEKAGIRTEAPVRPSAKKQPESPSRSTPAVPGATIDWTDLPRRKILEARVLSDGMAWAVTSWVTSVCHAPLLRARAARLGVAAAGIDAIVVFEVGRLLRKYPMFNAVHDQGRIGHYREINVGWAIDGGAGLVVPVIANADQKSVQEIDAIIQRQLEAYVSNTLAAADFLGGTFTVTDLSSDRVSFFQPLISKGQSAILGIGSEVDARGEEALYLTLAFDHQITEGRKAAQFLRDLTVRLEAHAAAGEPTAPASESPGNERYCMLCHRDSGTLLDLKAVLLKSEFPPGLVCSFCVLGW